MNTNPCVGVIARGMALASRWEPFRGHTQVLSGSIRKQRARRLAWVRNQRGFRGTWMDLARKAIAAGLYSPTNYVRDVAASVRGYATGIPPCGLEGLDQRCFAFARQLRQQPLFTEPTTGGTGR